MVEVMFWYFCKSSWRKGLQFLLLGAVFLLVVQEAKTSNVRRCGHAFEGFSLKEGKDAGVFKKLSRTKDPNKCIQDCCDASDCKTALFVGKLQACYSVECKSVDACKPVRASVTSLKYNLTIFKKDEKGDKDTDTSQFIQHKSCHHYHGTQSGCKSYLKNKLLYFNRSPAEVEKSLIMPMRKLQQKLSKSCQKYALAAVCYYAFPYCTDRSQPSPTFLCQEDCQQLFTGVCKSDFESLDDDEHSFLPDCKTLPSSRISKCIKLDIPASLQVSHVETKPTILTQPPPQSTNKNTAAISKDDEDDLKLFKQQVNKPLHTSNEQKPLVPNNKQNAHSNTQTNDNDEDDSDDDDTDETDKPVHRHLDMDKDAGTDDDIRGKRTKIPTMSTTSHHGTKQTVSDNNSDENLDNDDSDDADSDEDLNTPKRSKVSDSSNEKTTVGKKELNDNDNTPKPTALPSMQPSKPLGLGLKKSLNLLEPTGATRTVKSHSLPPTVASQTTLRQESKPTFVNVSNDANKDEVNLDVTDKPVKKVSAVLTPTVAATQSQNHSMSTAAPSPSPTKTTPVVSKSNTTASPTKSPSVVSVATTKPSKKPTQAPPTLQVSAGHNKVLTLPTNSVELYASAFPTETPDNPYTYHWQQMSAPQDSRGYMEGKDTRRVILTKLSHVGVYQFKVSVTGTANGAFGVAYVNVTVKPAPRINKPPRADISPKEQTITLPTNEVVLDGSKSSDDDKIVQYKWEEVKGPLNDKNKMISSGADSPVLQLKSLVPGIYTFKLTVIDSDGEKDETTATVTVNDEKDYPPVARAGNDVILTMPVNHVILNGNSSTDNKGIVSYEWSKSPSSPAVGDMQGTNTPFLKVSNMVVGDYTFILKVTDTGGLTSSSKVTVVVQPEKNQPPVAKAGSDKDLVFPDDSTTLDASESHDDQKIVKYHWVQDSGPSKAEISGVDDKIATVKKLQEGRYVFKLTVTDDRGLTATDIVAVSVKKDINQPPVANAGPDVIVHLPNRAAELDGSKSIDDHGITKYIWRRDPKSPAAGDVINNSDHQAILRLSNLVEGMYKFKLTVMDGKGLESNDEALLTVKEDENSAHLVELYLDVDITHFTEENKGQLIRKLAVILDVQDGDIVVEHLKEAGTGHSMMVMFYVKGDVTAKDGQAIAEMLKAKIENEEGFFEFRMLKVEPYICRNNCSFHGYCDRRTKLCVCESFWMQDIFKASFGVRESNCDWSILYVTVIIFGIVMAIGGVVWAICFCLGRRRRGRSRRRHRYAIIDEDDDDDKAESMEMLPKHKYSSLTLTDSDEDSDETTLFEAKKRIPNGSVNGSIGRKAM